LGACSAGQDEQCDKQTKGDAELDSVFHARKVAWDQAEMQHFFAISPVENAPLIWDRLS